MSEVEQLISEGQKLHYETKYKEAVECWDVAIQKHPDVARLYAWKGNTLRMLKRYDEAIQFCTKAIEINPSDEMAYANRYVYLASLFFCFVITISSSSLTLATPLVPFCCPHVACTFVSFAHLLHKAVFLLSKCKTLSLEVRVYTNSKSTQMR